MKTGTTTAIIGRIDAGRRRTKKSSSSAKRHPRRSRRRRPRLLGEPGRRSDRAGRPATSRSRRCRKTSSSTPKATPTASRSTAPHLYWSVNGETPHQPRQRPLPLRAARAGTLSDLTPDRRAENGAEVQGVLGASADGNYVYFAANGVLDGARGGEPGDCERRPPAARQLAGSCSLYLWNEGDDQLRRPLDAGAGVDRTRSNWAATPREPFGIASYAPKTAFVSADGQTLLFRSQEQLTAYDNEGAAELYRFRGGRGGSAASPATRRAKRRAEDRAGPDPLPRPIAPVARWRRSPRATSRPTATGSSSRPPKRWSPETPTAQGGCPLGHRLQSPRLPRRLRVGGGRAAAACKERPRLLPPQRGLHLPDLDRQERVPLALRRRLRRAAQTSSSSPASRWSARTKTNCKTSMTPGWAAASPPRTRCRCCPAKAATACHGPLHGPPAEPAAGSATFVGPGNPDAEPQKTESQEAQIQKAQRAKARPKKHRRAGAEGRQAR